MTICCPKPWAIQTGRPQRESIAIGTVSFVDKTFHQKPQLPCGYENSADHEPILVSIANTKENLELTPQLTWVHRPKHRRISYHSSHPAFRPIFVNVCLKHLSHPLLFLCFSSRLPRLNMCANNPKSSVPKCRLGSSSLRRTSRHLHSSATQIS